MAVNLNIKKAPKEVKQKLIKIKNIFSKLTFCIRFSNYIIVKQIKNICQLPNWVVKFWEDFYNFNKGRTSGRGRFGEKLQNQGDLVFFVGCNYLHQ